MGIKIRKTKYALCSGSRRTSLPSSEGVRSGDLEGINEERRGAVLGEAEEKGEGEKSKETALIGGE